MVSRLNPFLSFNTWADYGAGDSPDADRISFGLLETSAGYTIMAGDVTGGVDYQPIAGVSVSLSGDDADLLRGYWDKLSADGAISMPMQKQAWGDEFGMCADKFGVSWMVNISQPAETTYRVGRGKARESSPRSKRTGR